VSGTLNEARIPLLNATKIGSGELSTNRIPSLQASKIAYGELDAARIPELDATKITTGTFASADRIPTLPSSKIDATTTFAKSMINSAGEWATNDIPDLSADKITSDTLHIDRIPDIPTSKITAGHLDLDGNDLQDVNEIKFIAGTGNKITGNGTYKTTITNCILTDASNEMPTTASEMLMYRGVASTITKSATISTSYATLDSHTQGTFTAPSSGVVEVTLNFYCVSLNESIQARLVKGGTSTEFRSAYSIDSDDCVSTEGTYVFETGTYDNVQTNVTMKWILSELSSGSSYAIDAQVRTNTGTASAKFGSAAALANYPPLILKVVSVPTSSFYLYTP
jgi:hypothetical protein